MSTASRRPSIPPPPRRSNPPPGPSSPPPAHADFSGGVGSAIRFRPARVSAADLPADLVCHFRWDGMPVGPLRVLDLGNAGFAVEAPGDLAIVPGSVLEDAELRLHDRVLWSGAATMVQPSPGCIGARFDLGDG